MALTKKRMALFAVLLTVGFFVAFFFLPESIVGERGENLMFFAPKIAFLAITASMAAVFILVIIFRRDYINSQVFALNRYKYLLRLMIKRDFITKYRKSMLGIIWSILNPLLMMLVMMFVFQYLFRMTIDNFPVYFLGGRLIFGLFEESTSMGMNSIINNEAIIKKVYVPKYIFPVAQVTTSLVNVFFTFIAFMLIFIITGAPFHWTMFLIPIPIIYTFVFSLGLVMLLSSLVVFFRDMQYLWGVFTTMLFFLTPIMYSVEATIQEAFLPFYGLNPLYHFVTYFRMLTMWNTIPDLWANMVCIGYALASLCIGSYVFMKKQDRFLLHL
ncbi:MAG: ABC transporter permease [Oscillospiraceae bacterium]|jgi:ABC-type polysaccharide/polyol phosphate export permease|nr:ABC transporter permease [Oscillospiraceae bacterium]